MNKFKILVSLAGVTVLAVGVATVVATILERKKMRSCETCKCFKGDGCTCDKDCNTCKYALDATEESTEESESCEDTSVSEDTSNTEDPLDSDFLEDDEVFKHTYDEKLCSGCELEHVCSQKDNDQK